ncbi:hypothetical protein MMPV_006977 [Pyropia vietnamensis]
MVLAATPPPFWRGSSPPPPTPSMAIPGSPGVATASSAPPTAASPGSPRLRMALSSLSTLAPLSPLLHHSRAAAAASASGGSAARSADWSSLTAAPADGGVGPSTTAASGDDVLAKHGSVPPLSLANVLDDARQAGGNCDTPADVGSPVSPGSGEGGKLKKKMSAGRVPRRTSEFRSIWITE